MSSNISVEQLQALPGFPPQSPSIQNGQYAIKSTEETSQAGNDNDSRVETKVWFQSPVSALLLFAGVVLEVILTA
jgi:hypothetical protein